MSNAHYLFIFHPGILNFFLFHVNKPFIDDEEWYSKIKESKVEPVSETVSVGVKSSSYMKEQAEGDEEANVVRFLHF